MPRAAVALDHLNNDTLWDNTTKKELHQVIHEFSSFKMLDDDDDEL